MPGGGGVGGPRLILCNFSFVCEFNRFENHANDRIVRIKIFFRGTCRWKILFYGGGAFEAFYRSFTLGKLSNPLCRNGLG